MTIYKIDPSHTSINFSVKHMMIAKVRGDFNKFIGTFQYDPQHPEASHVVVEIEVSSIDTRDTQRDTHLRSADFFDVGQFPHITFNSKKIVAKKNGLQVTGDLTIRGITKAVTLDVEGPSEEHKDPWGNIKIGLSGETKIKRKEFGLTWNAALEAGGFLVGDDVTISVDVQLVKQPQ